MCCLIDVLELINQVNVLSIDYIKATNNLKYLSKCGTSVISHFLVYRIHTHTHQQIFKKLFFTT